MARQHHSVVELPGPLHKGCCRVSEAEREAYDVHSWSSESRSGGGSSSGGMAPRSVAASRLPSPLDSACGSCGVSAGFWFLGVNFLPQALQSRILRLPMVLVFLTPLLTDFPDVPQ